MNGTAATRSPAVAVRNLWKWYGPLAAVSDLDFDVAPGSFFGLVGPNGAGKSTALKICTGLLRPDAGAVWVDGVDVWQNQALAKQLMGVVPEHLNLFERLTGYEFLNYAGLLRALPKDYLDGSIDYLLTRLGLAPDSDKLIIDYSQGMRKKIAFAAAILHHPRVLFLDEPFESVDPISVRSMRALLEQMVAGGASVVFSSHVMQVVEEICDHVGIIHGGRLLAAGPTEAVCQGRSLEEVFVWLVTTAGQGTIPGTP